MRLRSRSLQFSYSSCLFNQCGNELSLGATCVFGILADFICEAVLSSWNVCGSLLLTVVGHILAKAGWNCCFLFKVFSSSSIHSFVDIAVPLFRTADTFRPLPFLEPLVLMTILILSLFASPLAVLVLFESSFQRSLVRNRCTYPGCDLDLSRLRIFLHLFR